MNEDRTHRSLWRRIRVRLYIWPVMHLPLGTLDRPIESFVAVLCVIAGLTQLLGFGDQQSVATILPHTIVAIWSLELVIGGSLVAVSVWRGDRRTERSGLMLLGVSALIYAICALTFLGTRSVYTACVTLAFSMAVFLRVLVISLVLQLEQALRDEDTRG